MALAESAGAAWTAVSATNSQSSASFTPAANNLVAVIVSFANGNGIAATSMSVTSNFTGTCTNTWVLVRSLLPTASNGGGGIWVMDAGSAPGAGVITATVLPSTVLDVALIVRQFAGALPAAQQTGAGAVNSGVVDTVSVTPSTTGSQIVGAAATVTTITANGVTTLYGTTAGTHGDACSAFEATSLSAAGIAVVVGFTATQAHVGIVAAEILPAVAGPYTVFAGTIASGSTSYPEAVTANTAAGHGVLVFVSGGGTGVVSGVTDSKGNTYALLQSQATTAPRAFLAVMTAGFAALTTGAADTITVSFSAAPSSNGTIQAVGVPGCPLVDVAPAIATGTSAAPSAGATPTGSGEVAVGFFAWGSAAGAGSAFSYTLLVQTQPSGAAYATITYSTAAASGVLTTSSATIVSSFWNAAIAIMKPSLAAVLIPQQERQRVPVQAPRRSARPLATYRS